MKSTLTKCISTVLIVLNLSGCTTNNNLADNSNTNTDTIAGSCSNVVIHNGYAYAACNSQLQIANLSDGTKNSLEINSDDIAIDSSNNTLFIQSKNTIQALELTNPNNPVVVASTSTNFGLFSGIDAANGIVIVSAGTSGSNTQVYRYTNNSFSLSQNGIPVVDNVTGNPDVHVAVTENGVSAFYSQDLGAVANWGIQIINLNNNGNITSTPPVITLTPQRFSGSFNTISPANFPVESEFFNNKLYVAHFAVNGIEIIDLNNNNSITTVNLGYQPINITTDGVSMLTVGTTSKTISILDPITNNINTVTANNINQARGIAATLSHIAIADRESGLIIIER